METRPSRSEKTKTIVARPEKDPVYTPPRSAIKKTAGCRRSKRVRTSNPDYVGKEPSSVDASEDEESGREEIQKTPVKRPAKTLAKKRKSKKDEEVYGSDGHDSDVSYRPSSAVKRKKKAPETSTSSTNTAVNPPSSGETTAPRASPGEEEQPSATRHSVPTAPVENPRETPAHEGQPASGQNRPSVAVQTESILFKKEDPPALQVKNEVDVDSSTPAPAKNLPVINHSVNLSVEVSKGCIVGPNLNEKLIRLLPRYESLPFPEQFTRIVQDLIRCALHPEVVFNSLKVAAEGKPSSTVMLYDPSKKKFECKKIPVVEDIDTAWNWLWELLESIDCCKNLFLSDFLAEKLMCKRCFVWNRQRC